jgi:hypothetical protein
MGSRQLVMSWGQYLLAMVLKTEKVGSKAGSLKCTYYMTVIDAEIELFLQHLMMTTVEMLVKVVSKEPVMHVWKCVS